MPENIIQPVDKYVADRLYKGVLTPKITESVTTNPTSYEHFLSKMYTEKYTRSYENFDKFKSAYQAQYGDPFKKKESVKPTPTGPQVQSFDTKERVQQPITAAIQEAGTQTQEQPSENYVTPLEGTQVATFQTGGERQQIPVEEAQKTLSLQSKQQELDALRSKQASVGLIADATDQQKQNLDTSKALQARNVTDATDPAYMEDYKQPAQSTSAPIPLMTADERGAYVQPYSTLKNAVDYTKIAGRQISGVIPGMIDVRNAAMEYTWEKISGNPGAYTQEERDAAFANANLAQKAWAYYTGERATAAYNEFEKNYMTGSRFNEESEAGAYAAAAGQIIPMFLTGGASVGVKGAQLAFKGASSLNKAKFLVNGAGKLIVETGKSPSTYIAAQQIFNDTFQQAYEATGDSDKAMLAAGINTLASAGLEALPFLNFTKRLDNMTGGTVKKVVVSGAVGGGSEMITEVAQTWTDNLVASNIYDETRQLTDGLYQSGEIGGVVGFTMSAIMAALHVRLKNSKDPYERQEIEKAIADTAAKQLQVQKRETILENAIENTAVVKTNEKVQEVLATPNIGTEQIIEATQIRKEMPNEESVGYKTVGMTNRINELMVEKNTLYDKVTGGPNVVEETKVADARAKAIDTEIRKISNDIAEVYAAPSKQIIDQETIQQQEASEIEQQTQEVINQPTNETEITTNKGAEVSSAKTVEPKTTEQKTKVAGKGKTPLDKRNVNNPDILTALTHEVSDVEDIALQAFVQGEISPTKEVYNELYKNSTGDKRAAIGIIRTPEKGGKTLDEMAHKLWENQPNPEQYSDDQFKNAIISVIQTNKSKKSAALKLNEKFNGPLEEGGKRVDSGGNELFETPNGWMSQDDIDDFIAAEDFKKDVSEDDYNEVMQEYDNLSDEEFNQLFAESQSEEKKVTIADKSETIREIKDKKLTHVQGVAMGSGVAKGTYLSTEKGNRYQGRGKKFNAEVEVKNPYTTSENNLNKERGDILKTNIDQFNEMDFEGAEIPTNPTIDDLSNSGTEKLADLFTKNLQDQGYDSMYFPESKTQEGELVVFDKAKVKLTEDAEITDAMKMSRDAYDQKYPEGNYDEARAEYTKDTENLMDANKKGETLEGVILMQKGLLKAIPMDTRFKKGTDKLKQAWIKATRWNGAIPEDLAFNYSFIRKNTIAQKIGEAQKIILNVEKVAKKHLGNKLTSEQLNAMNQVLQKQTPEIVLPEEVLAEIEPLRSFIDSLSLEMKSLKMITDDMHLVFDENFGCYLNRSYKKWDDPNWADNVPEEAMNAAVIYLKNEYIDFYTKKYEKSSSALKNKEKRLQDFRTSIANKESKLAENNNRLTEYKAKHDQYIAKLDDRIKKAKKRSNKEQVGPDLEGKNKKTKKEKKIEYLESVKSEAIKDFNSIYETKKSQFEKQNAKIQDAIAKAENAAYNLQQRNYPEAIQESLDKFTSPDDGEISALINQILYAPTEQINESGKAGAISGAFLKQRSEKLNNSPEIRALMGEYKDPFINSLKTTTKMITAIQNYRFQKQLKEDGMGIMFSEKATGDFHRKIEGDAFRGLTDEGDLYTTEVYEQALKNMNGIANQDSNLFRALVSSVKIGKTAESISGAFANYVSNVSNIATNAWNPWHATKKIVTTPRTEMYAEFQELKKLGVLGQSVNSRELADRIKDVAGHVPFSKYMDAIPGVDIAYGLMQKALGATRAVFGLGDDYARVIGFYAEVERYRNVYPEWSKDQLRMHAAKIVSSVSPTYDLSYPWVKTFRDSPFFSTFATFPAEIYKTTINQGYQIKKDLSDPKTRSIGAWRLGGVLAAMGLATWQIAKSATAFIGGDEEDEKKLRVFVPEDSKNNPLIFYRNENGVYTYTDAGRFTYHSNFIAPIIAFSNGSIDKDEFDSRIFRATMEIQSPFFGANIVAEGLAEAAYGYKAGTDEKIYSDNDTNYEKLNKITGHLVNKFEPTNVKTIRSAYDLAVHGKTPHGAELTGETVALSAIGIKSRVLDVTKQYSYEFYKHKEQGDTDKNKFERAYKNARNESEKAKAIEIYKTEIINQINKMSYLYHAALSLGGNYAEINKHTNKMPGRIKNAIKITNPKFNKEKAVDLIIKEYIQEL